MNFADQTSINQTNNFHTKNSGLEDTKFKIIAQLDELPKRSNSRQKMFSMHKMLFVKNLF